MTVRFRRACVRIRDTISPENRSRQNPADGGAAVDIRAIVKSSGRGKGEWDAVKPLRNWNADGWYFKTEGSGLKVYGTANGSAPPLEIVDLFHELDKSRGPRKPSRH
jgi:hypothetical protein